MLARLAVLFILITSLFSITAAQTAPSITSLSPSVGPVPPAGGSVTIQGANFGTQPGSVMVGDISVTATSWSDKSILVTLPATLPVGFLNVVVTVNGVSSNAESFLLIPTIIQDSPSQATVGTPITITGTSFGAQGTNTVTFNGTPAVPTSWSNTGITVPVPSGATNGPLVVTVNGFQTNGASFYIVPNIGTLTPNAGPVGTQVTIAGNGFGASPGFGGVTFNGVPATVTGSGWSDSSISVTVPAGATTGTVVVTASSLLAGSGMSFTVGPPSPVILGISPTSGPLATLVTITGSGFGAPQGTSTVTFGGNTARIANWTDTQIQALPPVNANPGDQPLVVTTSVASNPVAFTVIPSISSVSPTAGPAGATVMIVGQNFGPTGAVSFNATNAAVTSWNPTTIVAVVPTAATTGNGNVIVTSNATPSAPSGFTVTPAAIVTGISVNSGSVGTSVTITGSNFGANQSSEVGTVVFSGANGAITSWSDTTITAQVPSDAAPGPGSVSVALSGAASNSFAFTVIPSISSLGAASGGAGTVVEIIGADLGSSQGSGVVQVGSTSATIVNWNSTGVMVKVPSSPPGPTNVTVTAGGITTNTLPFQIAPTITTVSPGAGSAGATVTISGGSFGTVTGSVSLNGSSAPILSWSDSVVSVQVPPSASSGPMTVTSSGVSSNGVPFSVLRSRSTGSSLIISPGNFSMLVDDVRNLSLFDDQGNAITGASWSTGDSTIAIFADSTSPSLLAATSTGNTTITATYQGMTTQTNVSVFSGATLPAGSVMWSLPTPTSPTGRWDFMTAVQAIPTADGTSDVFSVAAAYITTSTYYDVFVQGMTVDGQQTWTAPAPLVEHVSPQTPIPDRMGGLLVLLDDGNSLHRLDGNTGQSTWTYNTPLAFKDTGAPSRLISLAVHPDQTVYSVAQSFWQVKSGGFCAPYSASEAHVIALDGPSGTPKFTVDLPQSHFRDVFGGFLCDDYPWLPVTGPLSIMPDGSVYLEVVSNHRDLEQLATQPGPSSSAQELDLIKIQSDGSSTQQQLAFYFTSDFDAVMPTWVPGQVIPDGQGGVLASWVCISNNSNSECPVGDGAKITHSGVTFTVPSLVGAISLVLGENDVAFATDGQQISAFNVNTGEPIWSFGQPAPASWSGYQLVTATAGGGLVAKDASGNVIRFDPAGTPTYDSWLATAGANAGGTLNNLQFVASDAWLADISNSSHAMLASNAPIDFAESAWGSPQADGASDPKITVPVSVYQLQDAGYKTGQIAGQVKFATSLWFNKAKIGLDWPGTVLSLPNCNLVRYPGGCTFEQGQDLLTLFWNSTTQLTDLRAVLLNSGANFSTGISIEFTDIALDQKGVATIEGYTPFSRTTGKYSNWGFIVSWTSGLTVAHEIGHRFQLPHVSRVPVPNVGWYVSNQDPTFGLSISMASQAVAWESLMCGPDATGTVSLCPDNPNTNLSLEEIRRAQKGAAALMIGPF